MHGHSVGVWENNALFWVSLNMTKVRELDTQPRIKEWAHGSTAWRIREERVVFLSTRTVRRRVDGYVVYSMRLRRPSRRDPFVNKLCCFFSQHHLISTNLLYVSFGGKGAISLFVGWKETNTRNRGVRVVHQRLRDGREREREREWRRTRNRGVEVYFAVFC